MEVSQIAIPTRETRIFLPEAFKIDSWNKVKPYLENLQNRNINTLADLETWLKDRSELETVLQDDASWRYIKMNIDTTDKALEKDFLFFITEIAPKVDASLNELNKKLLASPFVEKLGSEYNNFIKSVKKEIEIFRKINIPLKTELQADAQKYGIISAKMTVEIEGKQVTLQEATKYLKNTDRQLREEVYHKISKRRLQDKTALNKLFSELIAKRDKVAKNADFDNFRDYMFAELKRFDYTKQDCFEFHDAIANEVVPVVNLFDEERKKALNLTLLKPWDTQVDIAGKSSLKPFKNDDELIAKATQCFYKIRPYFGECLAIMKAMGHIDLASKKGKAPGGFNCSLYEVGVPFVYMNAVGSQQDLTTMVHEGGHAIHSFLTHQLPLSFFKEMPSEVAELASMSMELISMDYWTEFYDNAADLKRAKKEQLHRVLTVLPWVAAIDKFQHCLYENPNHTIAERETYWNEIMQKFSSSVVNWEGNEEDLTNLWQKQLHLFEVPFYYIEYGMSQLGAIAIWRNYKQNPQQAIDKYMAALKLGYTKSISEIYETAGVSFNFSQAYVKELVDFVKEELSKI